MIAIEIYRIRIGLNYSRQAKIKGIKHLNYFELLLIMALLLIAGVERNPGPASESSVSSNPSHTNKEQLIVDKFSIVHYNVQSLGNKIDLIESELCRFDVICISETWLDDRTSDEDIRIDNFKLFRRDRPGDHHMVVFASIFVVIYFLNEGMIWSCRILSAFGWKSHLAIKNI